MSKRDYYEILGLAKDASDDDIKKAYRKLASKYHPDKLDEAEKIAGEVKFKEAKEAYECLSDPEKREAYNTHGHEPPGGFTHANTHFRQGNFNQADFNEIFGSIFGGRHFDFNNGTFTQQPRQQIYRLNISLVDAYVGRTLTLDGNITLNIPPGIRSGTKMYAGGKLIQVEVLPHIKFKRANDDLLVDIEIGAVEAMLGVAATLDHLDGSKLQFSVPGGIQQGQIVKLAGKGMKNPETDKHGDLLIRVTISIPRTLTQEERAALKSVTHRESIII